MPLEFPDVDMPIAVKAAFGADPIGDPAGWTFTDLSSRLLSTPMVKRVGRGVGEKVTAAKTCTLTLDNDDGELTPLNPMSAYWPNVVLDLPMRVQIDPLDTGDVTWFEGFVASWQPDITATTEGTTAVIQVTLAGVLRRLSTGDTPLRSPLFSSMAGVAAGDYVPHAYWPMEDGTDATRFASGLAGGLPMPFTGAVTMAADDTLPGSRPLPSFAAGAYATAMIPTYTDTGQWVVQFVTKMSATSTNHLEITADGTVRKIVVGWNFSTQEFSVNMTNASGGSVYSQVWPFVSAAVSGKWLSVAFGMSNSGTDQYNMDYQILDQPGVTYGVGDLVASSLGRVTGVKLLKSAAAGTVAGHLGVYVDPNFSQGVDSYYNAAAMGGWVGETATERLERLCTENRIPITITGASTITMGPQQIDTFLANAQACELADGGILGEDGFGLGFICLSERYNPAPGLTIDLATYKTTAGTSPRVFQPTFDDQRYRNEWTISRPDGVTVVADDANTVKYQDSDIVNVETDEQVADQAWWRYHRDSVIAYRWAGTPVDLAANTDLIEDWLDLVPGLSMMRRSNAPSQHPPGAIDEMLIGWSETLSRRTWSATVVAEPAAPYVVAELDSATYAKLDTEGSELHAAATNVATTMDVATTSGPLWSTDDAEDGFPWWVDGEKVTVTDIAPSLVTYGAVGAAAHGNNASVVPSLPASLAQGNLMVMVAAIRNSGTGVPSTPAGWTRWPVFQSTDNVQVFAKVAGASESAPTVTFTGGVANADTSAQILRLAGKWHSASFALLGNASALNASAQNIAYPGLSRPEADNCIILYLGWKQDDFTSVATIAGATEIAEASTTTGDDQSLVWDYVIQTTAAHIPAGVFTVTGGASAISRGAVVAIRCDYQTATVTRSVNGVVKAHSAGAEVRLWQPWRWAL